MPDPGEQAPVTDTATIAGAGGNKESIDTRRPFDDMHGADLRDVIGKKSVALLFAAPQLCSSRVCGPVVDIARQLKQRYGDTVEFNPPRGLHRLRTGLSRSRAIPSSRGCWAKIKGSVRSP